MDSGIRMTPDGDMEAIGHNGAWQHVPKVAADRIEAQAAEIERLRTQSDQLARVCADHSAEQLAEIKRLRASIAWVRKVLPDNEDGRAVVVMTWDEFDTMRRELGLSPRLPFILKLRGNEMDTMIHPDDLAVDRFAAAMKAKLEQKRAEGRDGWESKEECSAEFLSELLRGHVAKGDPVDVANFAMMLHQRGERIAAASKVTAREALASAEAALIGPSDEYEGCAEALAKVRSALSTTPSKLTAQEAGRRMLAALDLSISGQKITDEQRAAGRYISMAASFAAEAYEKGEPGGADVHALARAFLTALADPMSRDLDYLRIDPRAAAEERRARALAEGGEADG